MMPHTDADIATHHEAVEPVRASSPPPEASKPVPAARLIDTSEHESSGADAWFPDYEAGSPWMPEQENKEQPEELGQQVQEVDGEPAAEPVAVQESAQVAQQEEEVFAAADNDTAVSHAVSAAEEPEEQSQEHFAERPQVPTGPKHVSNDSFARTVSQQPNLDDDDDPWSPPRANTDYFKLMPPNDRTNSFPVVPQLEQSESEHVEPLPMNQAEDIVNEIENHSESFDVEGNSASAAASALQQDDFWGGRDDEADFPAQLGGDLQGPEGEASDARYEEGVPLIDHNQDDDSEKHDDTKTRDPFAEDVTTQGGDDFFAQISGNHNSPEQQNFVPSLERKSTMQAMNGSETNNTTSGGALASPLEEEEDELLDETPILEQETQFQAEETTDGITPATQKPEETQEDLAAKWSEAFAEDDDDEFLLEDESGAENKESNGFDPAAFFDDDDEGFLEDTEELAPQPTQEPTASYQPAPQQSTGTSGRYTPLNAAQPGAAAPSNPYFPSASPLISQAQTPAATNPYATQRPTQPVPSSHGVPPRPAVSSAQSFADKSKGGYSSPYDLPMEVVKPKKRAGYQQVPRGPAGPPPGPPAPPRGASVGISGQVHPTPPAGPTHAQSSGSGVSPPASNYSGQSPSLSKPPQSLQSRASSFFEELPMSGKTRPASRTSIKGQPSPSQASFNGPPQGIQPPPVSMPTPPQEPVAPAMPRLVPPAPTNPYASLPAAATSAPSVLPPPAARYSPATSQGITPSGAAPPPSRYSPAPAAQRSASHGGSVAATPPSVLPHLPRTSSPLAHFEARPTETHAPPQPIRSGSLYEPRLNRMPSLPPTREVEEEDTSGHRAMGVPSPTASQLPPRPRQNIPPPLDAYNGSAISPPKRQISYGPNPTTNDIEPPPRSRTGSPGAMYGLRSPIKASEMGLRPSSAQGPAPPSISGAMASVSSTRPRVMSQKLNLIPPNDGREHDPLQRWKGVPLISWGVGGTLITSFPVDVPRYGMNQPGPMIVRSPGEIKVKTIKEVQPLEERLAKFPGPLRGKSKKKETVSWLTAGIEELEKGIPNLAFQTQLSHEEKRAVERLLLWKILRVMIENDGSLEGNANVDQAVRDILSLGPRDQDTIVSPINASSQNFGFGGESSSTEMQSDAVDSGTIQRIKKSLLSGHREEAVWDAADKRLWGHALLIANTVSPDLYHKVSQEFIKKEVNFPGHNNESLAALYSVLSGNHDESVDELVPVHARAGVQLVASSTGPANFTGLEGLEKWRETVTLILSNRSTGDVQALNSLGNLLSGYGRAEAAHICFIFARSAATFGGMDDPRSQFVLVGADNKTQSQQFCKETEALLLSEVYEYGLSLTGSLAFAYGVPHLTVYKLQHAITLAEHGYRDKALQYCDMILKDMNAQTKRSPYHHLLLESTVEDMRQRMLQAPGKEASGSWISKPSMGKVSDSMWNRFNKFVAGDEAEVTGQGSPKFEESGPFAQIQGGTPTVSRPASVSNATGMEMFSSSPNGYVMGQASLAPNSSPVLTRSKYAPAAASATGSPFEPQSYAPSGRSSMDRTSGEYNRSPYEPRRASDVLARPASGYIPNNLAAPTQGFPDAGVGLAIQPSHQPVVPPASSTTTAPTAAESSGPIPPGFSPYTPFSQQSSHAPVTRTGPSYAPVAPEADDKLAGGGGQSHGYEPPSLNAPQDQPTQLTEQPASSGGYEPPSFQPYGYEPPSYEPDLATNDENNDDEPKPKKKSFINDDDDNFPALRATSAEKSKSEKDRENEELFRKAAEEDGKSRQCQ